MAKKNSKARKALEKIYGKGCFMERAGIREVKGLKKDAHQMTYHHLRHQSEGGKATIENGANLKLENHQFLHSLSRADEEKINNQIRQWKMNFVLMTGNGEIQQHSSLEFPQLTKDEDCIIIKLEKTTEEQLLQLQRQKNKKQKFNRSRIKQETQRLIDDELYGEDYEL